MYCQEAIEQLARRRVGAVAQSSGSSFKPMKVQVLRPKRAD